MTDSLGVTVLKLTVFCVRKLQYLIDKPPNLQDSVEKLILVTIGQKFLLSIDVTRHVNQNLFNPGTIFCIFSLYDLIEQCVANLRVHFNKNASQFASKTLSPSLFHRHFLVCPLYNYVMYSSNHCFFVWPRFCRTNDPKIFVCTMEKMFVPYAKQCLDVFNFHILVK